MGRRLKHRLQEERALTARHFAVWMALVGALVCFGVSLWSSWPLGPNHVDEGGVTQIRLALFMLVLGQILSFAFLIFHLLVLLVRVKHRTDESSNSSEDSGRNES